MNGCNTNPGHPNIKSSIIDNPKTLKKMSWVSKLEENTKQKIKDRIQLKPQLVNNPYYNPQFFD
jgi:hypothetical protein